MKNALVAVGYVFPSDGQGWCDGDTKVFLDGARVRIAELADECDSIAITQDELDALTGYEAAVRRVRLWNARLADIMTAYRGLYDLLLVEVESGQIPWKFYNENRALLDSPLESYHCCQRLTADFIYRLEQGPIGACLSGLRADGDELVEAFDDLRLDMKRRARVGATAAAKTLGGKVETIVQDVETTQHRLELFAAQYTATADSRPLGEILDRLIEHRDATHGLIGDLRQSVQDRPETTAWSQGANWIAVTKRGLTSIWSQLTAMVSGVRDCLAMIDQTRYVEFSGDTNTLTYQIGAGAGQGAQPSSPGGAEGAGGGGQTTWPILFGGSNPRQPGQSAASVIGGDNHPFLDVAEDMADSLSDIATFTPTVNDGGGWGGGYSGGNGEAESGFYGRRIAVAYASVTGQPLPRDPRAFWNALRGTFPVDPLTGEIVAEPVRSVVSLYTDAGPLSSVQATLRQFTGLIIPDAHKLLEGLHSIDPDTDNERANALSSVVGYSFDTLAAEAGRADRPRKALVDDTLNALIGPVGSNPGFLDQLRDELGLNSLGDSLLNTDLVTTEEAQLMSNMNLLEEYAVALQDAYDRFFATPTGQDPTNGSFSGRAAFISLLFTVVAQSVREVEEAMSAVEFSSPERRTTFINDPVSGTRISIDSILRWIENLAVSTGPQLLADSGLIGLNRVLTTISDNIDPMVDELVKISNNTSILNPPPAPHPGLTHKRVRNALRQLDTQIAQF
jgi:hypothetical protein